MTADNTQILPAYEKPVHPFTFVVRTGLFVGFLDIATAFVDAYVSYGSTPIQVFQYIASGVFGKAAFSGGLLMAVWGCVFHFLIATSWTSLFFVAYRKLSFLSKNRIVVGILFGLFIWLAMNLVVLPLANTPKPPFHLTRAIKGACILVVMIGLPVSFMVHNYHSRKRVSKV